MEGLLSTGPTPSSFYGICNLNVERSKLGRTSDKFGGISAENLNNLVPRI